MKRIFTAALAMLLVLASVLTLASCGSTFGTIKANFEKAGYELKADAEKTIELTTDDGKLSVTVHTFQLKKQETGSGLGDLIGGIASLASTAIVYEFGSDADLAKALAENEDVMNAIKDAQESDLVNGNCLLMTINPEAVEIFKGTYEAKK